MRRAWRAFIEALALLRRGMYEQLVPRRIGQVFRHWWLHLSPFKWLARNVDRQRAIRRALEREELAGSGRRVEQPPLEHRGWSDALFRILRREALRAGPRLVKPIIEKTAVKFEKLKRIRGGRGA